MRLQMIERGLPIPRPKMRGGDVLYLDFDGCLHHEDVYRLPKKGIHFGGVADAHSCSNGRQHRLFEHAELLEDLLRPYPDVRIVLSTTWVIWLGYNRAQAKLPPGLSQRVFGATYHAHMQRDLFRQASRGMQVWADVQRRLPDNWLAIDDDVFDWPRWALDHLVCSDKNLGISAPHVRRDLEIKLAVTFSEPRNDPL